MTVFRIFIIILSIYSIFPLRQEPKEKAKPPPLSKYRRKTANARERNRMREINEAFISLQNAIPNLPGTGELVVKCTYLSMS